MKRYVVFDYNEGKWLHSDYYTDNIYEAEFYDSLDEFDEWDDAWNQAVYEVEIDIKVLRRVKP